MRSTALKTVLWRFRKPASLVSGLLVFALGLPVVAGWAVQPGSLHGFLTPWVPMHFDAALGFVIIGLSIFVRATFDSRISRALGAVACLIGVSHLIFDIQNVGPMPLDTGLSLTACGLGLLFLTDHPSRGKTLAIVGILGALAAGLGFAKIMSCLVDMASALENGASQQMTLPAALGACFTGAYLVASAVRRLRDDPEESCRIVPLLITSGLVLATLGFWQGLLDEELNHLHKLADFETIAYLNQLRIIRQISLIGGSIVSLLLGFFLQSIAFARRNEQRLQEIDQAFTSRQGIALKAAQIAIWSMELRTGKFWRSENHHELFGHLAPLPTWDAATFLEQILPEDRARIEVEIERWNSSSTPSLVEFRIRRQTDGEIRWLRMNSRVDMDRNGHPFQIVGIVLDITHERMEASEKKRVEAEARLAYERLERVIEATGQGIWERNLSEPSDFMDAQCRRIFGFSPDENASFETIKSLIYPEDAARIAEAVREHILNRTPRFEVDFRIHPREPNGNTVWARVKGLVHEVNGTPDRLVATVNDITARVADRHRLEAALERAEAGVEAKSAFLANISHEIRTPLNGIIGMADLIRETPLNLEQDRYVKIIQQSGATLLTLLNDILDLSKIEAGKLELDSAKFSPLAVVENQVEILFAKATEKNLSLATFVSPDLPSELVGDPGRIGQILLNFVGNAIKFTQTGGIAVRVADVKEQRTASSIRLRIEVEDTGIGLSDADKTKLFKPFTQASHSTAGSYGGTGLGLSICKRLVEAMGGQIGLESHVGVGSTFWCEFPLQISDSLLLKETRDEIERLRNVRCLVVDSDPITQDVVHRYIDAWSMRNGSVATVQEALPILQAAIDLGNPYLLTVIGHSKKGGDGLAVAAEITKAFGKDTPKLILANEFGAHIDKKASGHELIAEFLTYPIKQSDLFDSFVRSLPSPIGQSENSLKPARPSSLQSSGPIGRILVADDVAANQLLAVKLLESLGHKTASAANGKEVLSAISQIDYDLILMDCQMPEMDGFEATRKIRTLEKYTGNHIPIIALTANAMSGDDKKCIAAGMDDYLAKPIKKEKLNEMLRKWLPKKEKSASEDAA